MANLAYDKGKAKLLSWLITQTLKVALVSTSYTPAVNDDFMSNVVANELGVSGYSRLALSSLAVVQDDANTRAYITAANNTWAALATGVTIGWAVVFVDAGGADSANPVYGAFQTTSTPTNGGSFTIQWASGASVPGGVFQIS